MRNLLFCILIITWGCESPITNKTIDNVKIIKSDNANSIKKITLDSFFLKSKIFSEEGFSILAKDSLYLVDKVFCLVSAFNLKGEFFAQHLGKKSAYNLVSLSSLSLTNNDDFIISDNFKFLKLSKNWKFLDSSRLIYPKTVDNNTLLDKPNGAYPDLYELKNSKFFYPNKGGYLIINVESEHPKFNGFINTKYYENARNLALINVNTWVVSPIFGSWPNSYRKGKNYPYFADFNYSYISKKFYLNYEIDSLIYVFDKRYVPIYAFGKAGNMNNQQYISSSSVSFAFNETLRIGERKTKGYYDALFIEPKNNIILRSYFTGLSKKNSNLHRLQIYKKTNLIGDIIIPNDFKVIGYKFPYFYADGENQNGLRKIYTFSIF